MTTMSIIVAVTDEPPPRAGRAIPEWLAALSREARENQAEIILVGSLGGDDSSLARLAAVPGVTVRSIEAPRNALAPELWGKGLLASRAPIVAFTINQCVVNSGWGRAASEGLAGSDVGVGGSIQLSPAANTVARAIYFLRYSAFLSAAAPQRRQVHDIAGDNAAYLRASLLAHGTYEHGFWEIEPHHAMRTTGATLSMIPGMGATFGGSPRLLTFMRQRFAHGKHFGQWRVRHGNRKPWQIIAPAPLVPFVFLLRTFRRVSAAGGGVGSFLRCLAPFLSLATAWAAGEAAGALSSAKHRPG